MLDEHLHPLPFLKLHGCARYALDDQVPLVLTPTSYNNHEANRRRLYGQVEELSAAYPVVYCGHSLSDRRLSEQGDRSARPFHCLVSPDLEDEELALWAERRVEGVRATFAEFMQALDTKLGPLMRLPRQGDAEADKPYRKLFTVNPDESDRLAAAFRTDLVLVHSGIAVEAAEAERFYSGHDQGWGRSGENSTCSGARRTGCWSSSRNRPRRARSWPCSEARRATGSRLRCGARPGS